MDYWVFRRGTKALIIRNVPDDYPQDLLTSLVQKLGIGTQVSQMSRKKKKTETENLEEIEFLSIAKFEVNLNLVIDPVTANRLREASRVRGISLPVLCSFVLRSYAEQVSAVH